MSGWKARILAIIVIVSALLAPSQGLLTGSPGGVAAADSNNRFGLDFVSPPSQVANATRFGQASATGAGWDRFPMYWNQMQASRGAPIDFSATDAKVQADLAHGLQVQAILVGTPDWASTPTGPDLDAWSSFVSQTVAHYHTQIHYWEIWNEPDLLNADGKGTYWPWGVPAYYQLLKVGYLAVKAADPSATVLMGGLAFPYNNEGFLPQLLDQIRQDPSAAQNHGYFDVLAFHSYDRVSRMYELPLGYLGTPSFVGFRALLARAGLNPPIWANEIGVPVWDYASGKNAPGRATSDEQANYVVEALAEGMAAGIDRFFLFQLYDDGAGAVDPSTNLPAEFFGLIANNGTVRPGFQAYQSTINLLAGAKYATHQIAQRGAKFNGHEGVEIVTLYGTNRGQVTIAWNNDPGNPVSVAFPTSAASATILDKFGNTVGQATAQGGNFTVSLPGATNNNNFDCFTPHGCDPDDYIIGGSPVILVADDPAVPTVALDPLPLDSVAPVHLSWQGTGQLPSGATFDVQYRDTADGIWHDWLLNTTATAADFGAGSLQLQMGHSYEFRARARDASGSLVGGQDYPVRPLAATLITGGNVQRPPAATDAKIEIFWPQGNQPVSKATQANATVAMFNQGSTTSVSLSTATTLHLWRALNNGVAEPVATGVKRAATAHQLQYPLWDFNNLDVSAARDPKNREYFWVTADGQRVNSNVWTHGLDARTYFPQPDVPTSVLTAPPSAVDAKIEVVWPHDNQPVSKATQVNVSVLLFGHGGLQSVPANYAPSVRLLAAVDNAPLQEVGSCDRVVVTQNNLTYPTYQCNNIDVSAARDPHHRVYFQVAVLGVTTYSNVWAHGLDARTYFPQPDVPTAVAP
ncbi:MAG TPA: hypothetical protein VFZ25_02475 [Chloroflexota bacterium]|nr:hypothetical protein [Chloroflexota bacterium]